MQGVAIRAAKKMGAYVVAVDGNPNAVCASEVNRFENIDLKDIDALVDFGKKLQAETGLDGVFTAATDFSYSVARVAEACGLKSHSVKATKNATNKVLMRECFKKAKVNSVNFFEVTDKTLENIKHEFEKAGLNFPVVVKPADNMGARGCKKISNLLELEEAVKVALSFSRTKTAIVEEFIDGKEYSTEGFIFNGNFYITAIADRHIYFPPYFIEMGHTIPSNCSQNEVEELCKVFEEGSRALGLDYGVCKGDIFLSNGKAYVGEIAARLSGGYMSGWTVPYSSGLNVTELAIQLALGDEQSVEAKLKNANLPPISANTKFFCAERAWISIPGTVEYLSGLEKSKKFKGVKDVFPRAVAKSSVVFPTNNVEKCGNVLATGKTYQKACKRAEKATQKVILRLQKNNFKTELYLASGFEKDFNSILNSKFLSKKEYLNKSDAKLFFKTCKSFPDFFKLSEEEKFFLTKKIKSKKISYCEVSLKSKNSHKVNYSNKKAKSPKMIFPKCFVPLLTTVHDLQKRSLKKALIQMFKLEPKLFNWLKEKAEKKAEKKAVSKFWLAFIRGGIQGALYVYDCEK